MRDSSGGFDASSLLNEFHRDNRQIYLLLSFPTVRVVEELTVGPGALESTARLYLEEVIGYGADLIVVE